ncbi:MULTISPECIES: hypothetical protein [unclassified Microcoleus]|uniref:hypothetical protein n=1 Tax=unclassified Microcoleus TaxID=2642155 RepID=UPI0025FC258B|nr:MULTISPECIES: hypothetical protein [unclassified Microcoleus]
MNPIIFQLLRTILEVVNSQGNRLAVLEEEESRESTEELATIQQAQALLDQLTMGTAPTMPPSFPVTMPLDFAPSDI